MNLISTLFAYEGVLVIVWVMYNLLTNCQSSTAPAVCEEVYAQVVSYTH